MNNRIYQAGVARTDITPPVGIRLIGYAVREGVSSGVDQPLTATALALRGGDGTTVVLLAVDVVWMSVRYADEMRTACAAAIGAPAANILINLNHTHSSPATPDYFTYGPPEQLAMEREYAGLFKDRCAQACRDAVAKLQPARLAMGWSECHGNINRRQKMPDGTVLLGEDPNGTCDRSVGVLRVDDLNGVPIAVAYRYSCHTVTLGPKTNLISPDFIGPCRTLVETAMGCPSLFLQGCAGNINPASGIGQDADSEPGFKDEQVRLGHQLGGAVLQAAQSLRTHRRRAAPRLVQSVAVYWLYEYEPVPSGAPGSIRVRECHMELPLTPQPALAEARAERADWANKLAEARQRGASESEINTLLRFNHWAERRLQATESGPNPVTVAFSLQVIQLDGLTIVGIPFETLAETGLTLREALGPNTLVLGYSNGIVSYLPTPQASAEGGMEAKLAYKAYLFPSEIPGDWEPQIVSKIVDLCEAESKS